MTDDKGSDSKEINEPDFISAEKRGAMEDGKGAVRRDFLKKAVLGGLAVATTAGVAKKVVSVASERDVKRAYLNDVLPGDMAWKEREFVTMSGDEKKQMVKMFTENYNKKKI